MRYRARLAGCWAGLAGLFMPASCVNDEPVPVRSMMSPAEARALIARSLPASVTERQAWTSDIYAGLSAIQVAVTIPNLCAVIAVIAQRVDERHRRCVSRASEAAG